MPNNYKTTQVPISRSQEQIRKLLRDFGARGSQFSENFDTGIINIRFAKEVSGMVRTVSVSMQVPEPPKMKRPRRSYVRHGRNGMHSVGMSTENARREQMTKATYRAFHDWLKSQFVAVEFGLRTFEDAFLSDFEITTNDGHVTTLGSIIKPQLVETRPEFLLGEVVE